MPTWPLWTARRYHSEEGWTAAIRLILGHYGAEVEVRKLLKLVCYSYGVPRLCARLQHPHGCANLRAGRCRR